MALHRIVRPLVSLVGLRSTAGPKFVNDGRAWDIAIGGIPFIWDPTPNRPRKRTTAKWYKNQWDISNQSGEQSLNYWWLRSQSSFHGGSNQVYLDGTDATIPAALSALRYWDSIGVDVTTPGNVTLLNDTDTFALVHSGNQAAFDTDGATPVAFVSDGNLLYRVAGDGTLISQVTWGGAGTILALTTDGANYYAADATGIYKGTLAGGAGSLIWNTGSSQIVLGWVKQRLMAAIGVSVYELSGAGPGLPAAKFTHPLASWVWTDVLDGPQAIYFSGYVGARSEIYKFILDTSNAVPTLTVGIVSVVMPAGEIVYCLANSTNSFAGVGTSRGLRVGTFSGTDIQLELAVMPLGGAGLLNVACKAITARDRFFYANYTNSDGSAGVAAVDLTMPITSGIYAVSSHLRGNTGNTIGQTNILTTADASVESTIGTWFGKTNCTVAADATKSLDGTRSLKLTSVAAGLVVASTATGTSGYPVTPGSVHSFVMGEIGLASWTPGVTYYNSSGTFISDDNLIVFATGSASAWTTVGFTDSAPAGAAFMSLRAEYGPVGAGGVSVNIDEMAIYVGSVPAKWVAPGMPITYGTATYASGTVTQAGLLGTRLAFVVDGAGIFIEDTTHQIASGFLTTSKIRFDTSEPKLFRQVRFRGENSGSIACLTSVEQNTPVTVGTIGIGAGGDSQDIQITAPTGDYATLQFVFTANNGTAPTFHAYLLKALSAQARQYIISLPLLCFDNEKIGKQTVGHLGYAQERLDAIHALEAGGGAVLLEYLSGPKSQRRSEYVVIDEVDEEEIVPGNVRENVGGTVNLTLRTV